MSTQIGVGSICDKGANVMEVTMSQLVTELEELCQLRPSFLDFNNTSRLHQLNSFELFFLVVGTLVVGVLLGVVGVACFKRQVISMTMRINMRMKMMNILLWIYSEPFMSHNDSAGKRKWWEWLDSSVTKESTM